MGGPLLQKTFAKRSAEYSWYLRVDSLQRRSLWNENQFVNMFYQPVGEK